MGLCIEKERELRGYLTEGHSSSFLELNRLLWALGNDELAAALQIIDELEAPFHPDQARQQRQLRQQWPDPFAALAFLKDAGPRFSLAAEPLQSGGQAEAYILMDFAEWVNADLEFALKIIQDIRQRTVLAGDAGYGRLLHKNKEYKSWPHGKPTRNQCCFVASSLASYTQYAPATCRRVFLSGISSSQGGYYHFKRLSRASLDTDAGCFAFFGLTSEARAAAQSRQSALSHRIYEGGWR